MVKNLLDQQYVKNAARTITKRIIKVLKEEEKSKEEIKNLFKNISFKYNEILKIQEKVQNQEELKEHIAEIQTKNVDKITEEDIKNFKKTFIKNDSLGKAISRLSKELYSYIQDLQQLFFKIIHPIEKGSYNEIQTIFAVQQGDNKYKHIYYPPIFYNITKAHALTASYSFSDNEITLKYSNTSIKNASTSVIFSADKIEGKNNLNNLDKIQKHQLAVLKVYRETSKKILFNKSKDDKLSQSFSIYLKIDDDFKQVTVHNMGDYYEGLAQWLFNKSTLKYTRQIKPPDSDKSIFTFLEHGVMTVTNLHGFFQPDIFDKEIAYSMKKTKAQTMGIQRIKTLIDLFKQYIEILENTKKGIKKKEKQIQTFIATYFTNAPQARNTALEIDEGAYNKALESINQQIKAFNKK